MSKKNMLRSLGVLFVSALCLSACTPEEYGPCSIPRTKAHTVACSPNGNSSTATCAVDYVFDCDSQICGIYKSSEPFCTHRCVPTTDECGGKDPAFCACPKGLNCKPAGGCPEGAACREWIPGTNAYYCLPKEKGGAVSSSSSQQTQTPAAEENTSSDSEE